MERQTDRLARVAASIGAVVALVLGAARGVHAQSPQYLFGRGDFAVPSDPFGIVAGDFNGDGRLDLATVGSNPTAASVLLAQADGGFAAAVQYPVAGLGPLVVGDFNSDGKLDLAVGDGYAPFTMLVLLGNGDGTFQAPVSSPLNNAPAAMATGDFNGDGNLDIVASYGDQASMAVLLGNGDGTFRAEQDASTTYQIDSIAVGDFNGDGKLDVVTGDYNVTPGRVSVFLGNGNGTFQPRQDDDTDDGVASVIVADFNGDGIPDIAATASTANAVSVLLGKGDGTFNAAINSASVIGAGQLVAGDFNGDGKIDLAVGSGTIAIGVVMLGRGDGTFQKPLEFSVAGQILYAVVGDFNRDGKLDLAMAPYSQAKVSILAGDGDGTFPSGRTASTAAGPQAVTSGDFNGDGRPDLAVLTSLTHGDAVSLLLGLGAGRFQQPVNYVTNLESAYSLVTADFNGDGTPDLAASGAVSTSNSAIMVLLGNGDGSFQPPVEYDTSSGTYPVFVLTADFNHDGIPDLAVVEMPISGTSAIGVFIGNGDGTFKPRVDYAVSSQPWGAAAGDFNGDGNVDLAVSCQGSSVISALLGNGDGTFQSMVNSALNKPPTGVVTADYNGDGILDLVTTDYSFDEFSVLLGDGGGAFQPSANYSNQIFAIPVVTGDVNGDGKPDLVLSGATSNLLEVYLGAGNGTFGSAKPFGTNGSPAASGNNGLLLADVDGNGSLDVVATNWLANTVSLLLNVPVPAFSSSSLNFGAQAVGTNSRPMTLSLYDASPQPLQLRSVKITGPFVEQNHCPRTLTTGGCQIEIQFRPTEQGTQTGSLVIVDVGPGGSQTILLTGQGTAAIRVTRGKG